MNFFKKLTGKESKTASCCKVVISEVKENQESSCCETTNKKDKCC